MKQEQVSRTTDSRKDEEIVVEEVPERSEETQELLDDTDDLLDDINDLIEENYLEQEKLWREREPAIDDYEHPIDFIRAHLLWMVEGGERDFEIPCGCV